MNTISRRIISIIPVESGKINPQQKEKPKNFEEDVKEITPTNYMVTQNLPIYETALERHNKGRVVLVKSKR